MFAILLQAICLSADSASVNGNRGAAASQRTKNRSLESTPTWWQTDYWRTGVSLCREHQIIEGACAKVEEAAQASAQASENVTNGGSAGNEWYNANSSTGSLDQLQEQVRNTLYSLITERLIERAPPSSLPPPLPAAQSKTTRGRKKDEDTLQAAEAQAAAWSAYTSKRHLLPLTASGPPLTSIPSSSPSNPSAMDIDHVAPTAQPAAYRPTFHARNTQPPSKYRPTFGQGGAANKQQLGGAAGQPSGDDDDSVLLWRVCWNGWDRLMRHDVASSMLVERYGAAAGVVAEAWLVRTAAFEQEVQEAATSPLPVDDVVKAVMDSQQKAATAAIAAGHKPPDEQLTMDQIHESIGQMCSDGFGAVRPLADRHPPQLVIELQLLLDNARNLHTQSFIQEKYGVGGLRVWKVLQQEGHLELAAVARLAMLEQKDARSLLYRLFADKLVSVLNIPKTADHAPSRTFYTWHVDDHQVREQVVGLLYKTAFNLLHRYNSLEEKEHVLLKRFESATARQSAGGFSDAEYSRLRAFLQRSKALLGSLLRLDYLIAVYADL